MRTSTETQLEQLRSTLSGKEEELNSMRTTTDDEAKSLRYCIASRDDELVLSKQAQLDLDQEIEDIRTALSRAEQDNEQLRETQLDGDEELDHLRAGQASRDGEIVDLKAALANKERVIENLHVEVSSAEDDNEQLRETQQTKDQEIERLEAEQASKDGEIIDLKATIADKEQLIDSLRAKVSSAEGDNEQLRATQQIKDQELERLRPGHDATRKRPSTGTDSQAKRARHLTSTEIEGQGSSRNRTPPLQPGVISTTSSSGTTAPRHTIKGAVSNDLAVNCDLESVFYQRVDARLTEFLAKIKVPPNRLNNPLAPCIHVTKRKKKPQWTITDAGKAACHLCVKTGEPYVVESGGSYIVLPLPELVRGAAEAGREAFYVTRLHKGDLERAKTAGVYASG
ncbi:hypothetical protein BDV95DRAFT_165319 [Massariosphaeria phaeospora]|uniref:Uncharacterized protein n=1 Tax=Massariosphaeria phaeospora TaxID=100035 RepID=A0A7C8M7E9_9PLEO|nr:hypothetical protein BDV95DRAFT_165319 [Massariosphaeria phaeospora]